MALVKFPDLDWYEQIRTLVSNAGYSGERDWTESLQVVNDPLAFWGEYSWVVINSGMKEQIARTIWGRVEPAVAGGGSASDVFGHEGKSKAIDSMWQKKKEALESYLAAEDKLEHLEGLSWVGKITKYHLARNLGEDFAKPDRHLVRIAGDEGCHELCARLARLSGDRIATVDIVIWRAANLGIL